MNEPSRSLIAEARVITAEIIENLLSSQRVEVTDCTDGQSSWERPVMQAEGCNHATYQGSVNTVTATIELAVKDNRSTR